MESLFDDTQSSAFTLKATSTAMDANNAWFWYEGEDEGKDGITRAFTLSILLL